MTQFPLIARQWTQQPRKSLSVLRSYLLFHNIISPLRQEIYQTKILKCLKIIKNCFASKDHADYSKPS